MITRSKGDHGPLFKFRANDRVIVWTTPCARGRTRFRIQCIGRTDDMLIARGVNIFPSAVKDVIASFSQRTTCEMLILRYKPGSNVELPVKGQIEYAQSREDLPRLKGEIEEELENKLVFMVDIQLVPDGTHPRYEMKAKLIRKLHEEEQKKRELNNALRR